MTSVEYAYTDGQIRRIEDVEVDPLTALQRKADHIMAELTTLKEAVADVAVAEEAAVAYISTLKEENAKLKETGSTGGEAEQAEVNELATSATTSADALKAAVPAAEEPPPAA